MPYILNGLERDVKVKVFGKYFDFKPGQIKAFESDAMCDKIEASQGEEGLVRWPDEAMEWDRKGPEWTSLFESKRLEAKMRRYKKLEWIRYNEEVSLKKDLSSKNIQANPFVFANRHIVDAYRELESLKAIGRSTAIDFESELTALVGRIDGNSNSPNTGKPATGSADNTKTTKG